MYTIVELKSDLKNHGKTKYISNKKDKYKVGRRNPTTIVNRTFVSI